MTIIILTIKKKQILTILIKSSAKQNNTIAKKSHFDNKSVKVPKIETIMDATETRKVILPSKATATDINTSNKCESDKLDINTRGILDEAAKTTLTQEIEYKEKNNDQSIKTTAMKRNNFNINNNGNDIELECDDMDDDESILSQSLPPQRKRRRISSVDHDKDKDKDNGEEKDNYKDIKNKSIHCVFYFGDVHINFRDNISNNVNSHNSDNSKKENNIGRLTKYSKNDNSCINNLSRNIFSRNSHNNNPDSTQVVNGSKNVFTS